VTKFALSHQGCNYIYTARPRRPSNARTRRVKGTLCRWEKEILSLGPKTSPGQGAHVVFSAGGPEFEVTPLIPIDFARVWALPQCSATSLRCLCKVH